VAMEEKGGMHGGIFFWLGSGGLGWCLSRGTSLSPALKWGIGRERPGQGGGRHGRIGRVCGRVNRGGRGSGPLANLIHVFSFFFHWIDDIR
jgi:hypothetical protein